MQFGNGVGGCFALAGLAKGEKLSCAHAIGRSAMPRTVIITCAITGAIHTPPMSAHLPVTSDAIVESALGVAEPGAAILHLHARDPETGRPDPSVFDFEPILAGIAQRFDVLKFSERIAAQ